MKKRIGPACKATRERLRAVFAAATGALTVLAFATIAAGLSPSVIAETLRASDSPTISEPPSADSDAATMRARARLHRVLDHATSAGNGVHDACIGLATLGDSSSVPHLIRALRLFWDAEPGPNVGLECTQMHCVNALETLTGAKVGVSYSSWKAWWEKTHPGIPLGNAQQGAPGGGRLSAGVSRPVD